MKNILDLIRINQWIKNLFIFAPLVFSGHLTNPKKFSAALLTTVAFCCVVSSIYILNDLTDFQRDRLHPVKKRRPLSSNSISHQEALELGLVLLMAGMVCGGAVHIKVLNTLLAYMALHLMYNWWARNVAILDVLFITAGFLLRVWAGALAVRIMPSLWLLACVFILSLFLGFAKRRCEMSALHERAIEHRPSLLDYRSFPLDIIIIALAALTTLSYVFYTFSPEVAARLGFNMVFSSVFVIAGVSRYLYLIYVKHIVDDVAEIIFNDVLLLVIILLWLISIAAALYLFAYHPAA